METQTGVHPIPLGRWKYKDGPKIYTALAVTNTTHVSDDHPPQVVYQGDNGNLWSCSLAEWHEKFTFMQESRKGTVLCSPLHQDLHRIAHLIGSIFFAGDFKAETANERELEELLIRHGYRYRSWEEIQDAAQARPACHSQASAFDNSDLAEEPVTVQVHLPHSIAAYLHRVAAFCGEDVGTVASVMFAMAGIRDGIDQKRAEEPSQPTSEGPSGVGETEGA